MAAEIFTSEQAINKAAADLGRYVPGEALGAIEHDVISAALDRVIAEIAKIIAISDRDEIPAVVFETVCSMVAMFASSDFSNVPYDPNRMQDYEQRLRYLVAQTPTYEPLQAQYF